MTFTRKKLIIIGVWAFAVMAAIIAMVFACNSEPEIVVIDGSIVDSKYTCYVTFDMNGGKSNGYTSSRVAVEKDSYVKRPSYIPYREGYVFWGWNATGGEWDPMWQFDTERITKDVTIYATWVAECTVTFNAEGGTFEDGTDAYTVTLAYGTKVTAPKVTPPDTDMELTGWKTEFGYAWDFNRQTAYDGVRLFAQWEIKRDIQIALAPFRYTKTDDGYVINGVTDKNVSGTVSVPSIVTSITDRAFSDCHNLVSVIIPDSVTDMGGGVFEDCENLKSVTLPSGLTSLQWETFEGCSSLESIRLPDTVTDIGYRAFGGCRALADIQIPANVKQLDDYAFEDCSSLESIRLPDTVTDIGYRAFVGCRALVDIQIPAALEKLDSYAFEDCSSLKSITIPASCKEMGSNVFKACTNLTSAELHCLAVNHYTFYDCTALTDVVIGDEVLSIDFYYVFYNCKNLRNVTIGNGLTAISSSAFSNCYNLRNVSIGSGVKEIKSAAFSGCDSLLSITIPSSVEAIGEWAFSGCYKLVEVYNLSDASYSFRSSVTVHTDADEESIIHTTDDGFSFCILKDENVYPYAQTPFLIDYSGDKADIVLPDSYNGESYKVYKYALAYNDKLKSVKFSAGVTEIKSYILYKSDNVTSLTVDSGNTLLSSAGNCVIKTADKKFILGCKTSVIPDDGSVTTIGEYVFCANTKISSETFIIPDTVTQVDNNAFNGCSGIMRTVDNVVYVDKWAISLGDFDLNSDEKLDLQFQSGTVGIAENAFLNDHCIQSVTFNDEMRYVGDSAFSRCDELITVNFNDGLLIINGSAFYGCVKLQEAVLPDSVTALGWGVFHSCTALTYAKLPAELTKSNTQIFYNCNALNAIVIPQSIEEIGYSMFSGCPDTVKVYYEGSEQQWNAIEIKSGNTAIVNATKYFYSETEIEGANCWHYDADGKPTNEYN